MNSFAQSEALGTVSVIVGTLFGAAVTIFWMWIGWRAMRAHERIADSLEAPAQQQSAQLP